MVPRDVIHYHQILIHSEQSFQTMDGRNNNNNVIPINSLFTIDNEFYPIQKLIIY